MRIAGVLLWATACLTSPTPLCAAPPTPSFQEDFAVDDGARWEASEHPGNWIIEDGTLRRGAGARDTWRITKQTPAVDVVVDTQLRVDGEGRQTFGVALRASGNTYLLLRYYDAPQALEVLSYRQGEWERLGSRSHAIELQTSVWYRLKAAVIGDTLLGKLWPTDQEEPDWQLDVQVANLAAGQFGVVAHDNTNVQFDWFHAWSGIDAVEIGGQAVQAIDLRRRHERAELLKKLHLTATPTYAPIQQSGVSVRRVNLVTSADTDRHPIGGQLTVTYGREHLVRDVMQSDFVDGTYVLEIPEPMAPLPVSFVYRTEKKELRAEVVINPAQQRSWREYVCICLDTLIEHGRDDYGSVKSPLFMAVLDADTLRSPRHPLPLDALVRLEGRMHRRGERGSNLWYDQSLLRALYRMSELTGDAKYATAADEYVRYFLTHCNKLVDGKHTYQNGMPAWGTHVYWDCFEDRPAGDGEGNGPHEILVFRAEWPTMYRLAPDQVRRIVEGIWQHHIVNKQTGLHNRHDDQRKGCDFAFSGSSFAHALAFMHQATGNPEYLRRAKIVAGWHWNHRHRETGLTADSPGLTERYDGHHCFTTVVGPHAMGLLECYALSEDVYFRDAACGYIKSYDRYGWDAESQTYWAMLQLDGTPLPDREKGSGYGAYAPYGHVNVWRTTFYSYEFTLSAAQAAVQAYDATVRDGAPDTQLLRIAKRWASVVERAMPAHTGRRWKDELEKAMPRAVETSGAYAEDYGRAISLFVHMARATGEQHYLRLAEELAEDAVAKLYYNGLFLGHPAKPYYETTNGVGLILTALLELDSPHQELGGAL